MIRHLAAVIMIQFSLVIPVMAQPLIWDAGNWDVNTWAANVDPSIDSDGDGVADINDAFPDDPAASVDTDGDGYPDAWNDAATPDQIAASLLVLDAFPNNSAASIDADQDGLPDEWNAGCDLACQQSSGLTLDTDRDNDGIDDALDPFPYDPTPVTPLPLSTVDLVQGLIGFIDAYQGVDPDFPLFGSGGDNWFFASDGSFQRAQWPEGQNRVAGDWTVEDRSGEILVATDLEGAPLIFFVDRGWNLNFNQNYQTPADQIEVIRYTHSRWALVNYDGEKARFAREITYEEYAVDPAAALDPSLPIYSERRPVTTVDFIPAANSIAIDATNIEGSAFAIAAVKSRPDANSTFMCPSSGDCTDLIQFEAGGTGRSLITDNAVTWQITLAGHLELVADVGLASETQFTISKLRPSLSDRGFTGYISAEEDGVAMGQLGYLARLADNVDIAPFIGVGLSNADLQRNPDARNENGDVISAFGWRLDADEASQSGAVLSGAGENLSYNCDAALTCNVGARDMTWTYDGVAIEIIRFYPPEWNIDRRRTWRVLSASDNELYVLETLVFTDSNVDPSEVVRYSRVNIYGFYDDFDINDVDADGVPNGQDAFPTDEGASVDTDGDGMPDDYNANCDADCRVRCPLVIDEDDDNDGLLDVNDYYPTKPITGYVDQDGDGRPDVCDTSCQQETGMLPDPCPTLAGASCFGITANDIAGSTGETVTVVVRTDVDISEFEGLAFSVQYSPDDLALAAVNAGVPGTGVVNDQTPGNIRFSFGANAKTTIASQGILAELDFTVLKAGAVASTSSILFDAVEVNGEGADVTRQAQFTYEPLANVYGDDFSGYPGTTVTLNLRSQAAVTLLEGVTFTLTYEDAILSNPRAVPVDSDGDLTIANSQPGELIVSFADGSPSAISEDGIFFGVEFDVEDGGAAAREVPLTLSGVNLNGEAMFVATQPSFYFEPLRSVAGSARHWQGAANDSGALAGAVLWTGQRDGDAPISTAIAIDGSYGLNVPADRGVISLEPVAEVNGGITAFDAVIILRVEAELDAGYQNAFQALLADVDGDGDVDTVDASRILQASVGNLTLPFQREDGSSPYWVSRAGEQGGSAQSFDLSNTNLDSQDLQFVAGLLGDVSGNWRAPSVAVSQARTSAPVSVSKARMSALTTNMAAQSPLLTIIKIGEDRSTGVFTVRVALDALDLVVYSLNLDLTFDGFEIVSETINIADWQGEASSGRYALLNSNGIVDGVDVLTLELRRTAPQAVAASIAVAETSIWGGGPAEEGFGGATEQAFASLPSWVSEPDGDADGTPDAADQCPLTPNGVEVDDVGCDVSGADADNDGIPNDADQCPNSPEGDAVNEVGCALSQLDSDNDGLSDAAEIALGTSPSDSDSDDDGLSDAQEVDGGTDPLVADSDGDSWLDGEEVEAGTDPNNAEDEPVVNGLNIMLIQAAIQAQEARKSTGR